MALYTFVNGSDAQKEHWRLGPSLMHNLTVESLLVAVTVEFVPYSELEDTSFLAETFWTVGDSSSETKVRLDYPIFGGGDGKLESLEAEAAKWGLEYNGLLHANETPVHELGHSIFAALPEPDRLAIARLFGADSTDQDELAPPGSVWEDRIAEGIAETFKEAFLPARYRVFPNRTNRRISYKDFPEFRRHIRGVTGEGNDSYCYLYGSGANRQHDVEEKLDGNLPVHKSDRDPEAFVEYQEIEKFGLGYGVHMRQFKEAGKLPFTIEPAGGGAS